MLAKDLIKILEKDPEAEVRVTLNNGLIAYPVISVDVTELYNDQQKFVPIVSINIKK